MLIKKEEKWTAARIMFCESCIVPVYVNVNPLLNKWLPNDVIRFIKDYYIGPKEIYGSLLHQRICEILSENTKTTNKWIWYWFVCDVHYVTIYIHTTCPHTFHFQFTHPDRDIDFTFWKKYTYDELESIVWFPAEAAPSIWKHVRLALLSTYHDHVFVPVESNRARSLIFYFQL